MPPERHDVEALTFAMVRISDGMSRARKRGMDPTRLAVLQSAAIKGEVRPSEIAAELGVHQSSVTRQVRALEDEGNVRLRADPDDRRSCLISLTGGGTEEVRRLTQLGIDRFHDFVQDWPAEDVHTLVTLLNRFEESIAEVKRREQSPGGRRWQTKSD